MGGAHDNGAQTISKGGEAQAAESVGDELETPQTDGFTEGRNIMWQTLTAGSGDERR
jgi:hypothetical protein